MDDILLEDGSGRWLFEDGTSGILWGDDSVPVLSSQNGITLLAWQNAIAYASLTASAAATNLPVENLKNDIGAPSVAWQTPSGTLTATLTVTMPATQPIGAFGLFRTNLTPEAVVTVSVYSSSTLVYTGTMSAVVPGYGQAVLVADTDYSGDSCVIEISDSANSDTFLNIPLAFVGPAYIPTINMSWDSGNSLDIFVDQRRSIGGQVYPTPRSMARKWDVSMEFLTNIWTQAAELRRFAWMGGNVLFIPNITSSDIGYEAVFGQLASTANITFVRGVYGYNSWKFSVTERL